MWVTANSLICPEWRNRVTRSLDGRDIRIALIIQSIIAVGLRNSHRVSELIEDSESLSCILSAVLESAWSANIFLMGDSGNSGALSAIFGFIPSRSG